MDSDKQTDLNKNITGDTAVRDALLKILKVTASMLTTGISGEISEWELPKTTPKRTKRKIIQEADKWNKVNRLRAIELKSAYDVLSRSAFPIKLMSKEKLSQEKGASLDENDLLNIVSRATSRDYNLLFDKICKGEIVPCFVDYHCMDGEKPFRDIAKVRRHKENSISIGARGIQYGGVYDFSLEDGRTELKAFTDECERMNLEYFT